MLANQLMRHRDLKKLINVRLKYLKLHKRRFERTFLILTISILILTPINFFILETASDLTIIFLLSLIVVSSALATVGMALFSLSASALLRINYISLLDMIRLLMLVAMLMAALSTVMWASLLGKYVSGTTETIHTSIGLWIYYTDTMYQKLLSFSILLLNIIFIMHRKVISNILNMKTHSLYIFVVLNFLSVLYNLTLALPFILFILLRPKIVYVFAYTDLGKLVE